MTPPIRRTVQSLFDLTGRVAIVTGGAGLLGRQFSEALVEAGASVLIASRTLDACRVWAAELDSYARTLPSWAGREEIPAARACAVDITQPASCQALVGCALDTFGRLDILVNNAYTRGVPAPPEELTPASWQTWVDAGLSGPFYCTQAAAVPMLAQGSGVIVNIGSIYGVGGIDLRIYPPEVPVNASAAYAAVKGGVVNLTRYLATVWAPHGIRVNCISPGGFPTESINPEFAARFAARVPLQRMGSATDLKGAIVYLCADASAYVTGHNLLVDGGWTAW